MWNNDDTKKTLLVFAYGPVQGCVYSVLGRTGSVPGWREEVRGRQGSAGDQSCLSALGRTKALRTRHTGLVLIPAHAIYQFSGPFFKQLQINKLSVSLSYAICLYGDGW